VNFCRTFCNSLQILAEICKEDTHLMSPSNCKFHKNLYNEGHAVPKDVSDIVTIFPTFFLIWVKFSTGDDVEFAAKITLAESFLCGDVYCP
jgi:hypothetical protein